MRFLVILVAVILTVPVFGAWQVVTTQGNTNGAVCEPSKCYLKDMDTGLIWSYTVGRSDLLNPSNSTQQDAKNRCGAKGHRLPSYREYVTALQNGLATLNRNFRNFGDPQWFFWAADNGIAVSLENPAVNPVRNLQRAKFKCVFGGGGGGGNANNPAVQIQGVGQVAVQKAQEFAQQGAQIPQNVLQNLELPTLATDVNTGKLGLRMPRNPNEQANLQKQKENPPNRNPQPGNGVGGGNQGFLPKYRTFNQSWGYGNDNFGFSAFYELGADQNANGTAVAGVTGLILKRRLNIVRANVVTERIPQQPNSLRLSGAVQVYGQNVDSYQGVMNAQTPNYELEGKALHRGRNRLADARFMVGPIPMRVSAGLEAEFGYRPWRFSFLSNVNNAQYGGQIVPYARSGAFVEGGPDVVVASAGARGRLNFVNSSLRSGFFGATNMKPCFEVYLHDFRALNGDVSLFAEWQTPITVQVKTVVDGVCSKLGGLFGKRVCGPAREFFERVTRITTFSYERPLFSWGGVDLGQTHRWVDTCPK